MDSIIIACHDAISYRVIAHEIGKVLGKDYQVYILDCGYHGEYHTYPFSLIAAIYQALPSHINYLRDAIKPKHTIFIFDLDKHLRLETALHNRNWEYTAIFPVESWPLPSSWAEVAKEVDKRFVISHFGVETCKDAGLDVTYLPLGIDADYWIPGDRDKARSRCGQFWLGTKGIKSDEEPLDIINRITHSKVVLTIADNQERKNLPACFEIMSKLDENVMLVIVAPSKEHKGHIYEGWDLHALAKDYGLQNRFVWVGGLSKDLLREHYRASDIFLLPSQAEGYGLPLREASACGLPWVATDCTAVSEAEGGVKIPAERVSIFPLGNQRRYWIDTDLAASAIEGIVEGKVSVERPSGYSTWENCVEVLVGK